MFEELPAVRMTIGGEIFHARLRCDLAPRSCDRLVRLLPYQGELVHARWSGQACWSPLSSCWPTGERLAPENATSYPSPGEVLLFGGDLSEPELLIAYGRSRFASMAGPLAGNPVLTIEDRLDRLIELGSQILWRGAVDLRIEHHAAPSPGRRGGEPSSTDAR
jgi:Protein of unknown function (DUF3830)